MNSPDRFGAIDWGGTHNQLCVVDDAGVEVVNQRFTNDVAGSDALFAVLTGNRSRLGGVAIERSEGIIVERLQRELFIVFSDALHRWKLNGEQLMDGDDIATATDTIGTLVACHSWDATSTRARRRADRLEPTPTHAYELDVLVHPGPNVVQLGKSRNGLVVYDDLVTETADEPMVSLLDTPTPKTNPVWSKPQAMACISQHL
jgi:hypothetical protein